MNMLKENRQLVYLFLCNFSILFIGFGLFPILPLYAAEFGSSPSFTGIYLAITYIAISIGSILAGQLSERLPRKSLFVSAGLLGIPALFLLGQARSLWQVVALTALVWFAGGIGLSISNVLTGLHTNSSERGKAFGMLALASPLGAMMGGLVVGKALQLGGYSTMFIVLSIVWSLWPVLALTRVKDPPICSASAGNASRLSGSPLRPNPVFTVLLGTILLASMAVSVGRMGLSLAMKDQHFSAGEISTANAIGGLVTIPVTLLISTLSDRLGRKRFLLAGYLVALGSMVMLFHASELWEFWTVSTLVLVSRSVISSLAPAYATDVVRRRFLGKALPLVGTMNWVSGVIGFAGAGYVLDTFGGGRLYGAAALICTLAVMILALLPASLRSKPQAVVDVKKAVPTTGD